ncbi:DUF3108 domain-containing protein [Candidatus Sororendozoicomonas aggregata]|uniref:DUF3108 domain-containing protein n=1 Tax=Candidatus Sororendozoicomonas aggregata TaxID=3073239 RepID=UPI002ED65453
MIELHAVDVAVQRSSKRWHSALSVLLFFVSLLLTLPLLASVSAQSQKAASATGKPVSGEKQANASLLKPYTAELKGSIKGLPMTASGSRTLQKNSAGDWELVFDANAGLFGIKESSSFHVDAKGHIQPDAYQFKRSGFIGSKKEESAEFDWKKSQVKWSKKDKQWAIALKSGALDNLSYQTQLRMDLAAGKTNLKYLIADDDEVYEREFSIVGEEVINTEAGKLNTVKIKVNRDNDKRETYIWFAKDWDYFFVKLLQKEGGSEYTVEIKNATIDGKPIEGIKDAST